MKPRRNSYDEAEAMFHRRPTPLSAIVPAALAQLGFALDATPAVPPPAPPPPPPARPASAKMIAPMARDTDPVTSHAAADSMQQAASQQRAQIVALLQQHPGGMIADAIDAELGWRETTAGRRLIELIRLNLVERTNATRLTRSGRAAYLHRAVMRRRGAA